MAPTLPGYGQRMPIAHRELGSPDAPALVLVHGLGASGRALERVAPLLAARFRVIVPDLPGFGDSGGAPATIEGMARAVLEVVEAETFVAAGHSMGGLVATALAEL
jgi:magnesium chelatase accessory protein